MSAIDSVFTEGRSEPLLVGSVKSNLGHAEAASGMNQAAKVIVAFETGIIPANLHLNTVNPNIQALVEGRVKVTLPSFRHAHFTFAAT